MNRSIVKDYVSVSTGQIHRRQTQTLGSAPPLYCLHATAYSGRTFEPFMRAMGGRRRVAAVDTPGYGASDRPPEPWDVSRYAQALGEAIAEAETGAVDLFGYHTGAFLAAELAVQRPELVRKLVLVGIPYFEGAEREEKRETLGKPTSLTEQLSQFDERWEFFVSSRAEGAPLEQGFAHFVDELIAYPDGWRSHDAAFRYPAEQRLGHVDQPTLVLNPNNHLSAASRAAAALMPQCEVLELPHLSNAVLDVAAPELADLTDAFLEMPQTFRTVRSVRSR